MKPKRAAIYCRVSRDEQAENYSLPTQEDACRKYAISKGYEIVDMFREDFTGTNVDRPELNKVMRLAKERKIDVLVCHKIDRLSRGGVKHVGHLLFVLEENKVRCETVLETTDDTADGEMMTAFRAGSARREVNDIRERTNRGLRAKAKSGKPIGRSRPPFGLRYIPPTFDADGKAIKGTVNAAYEPNPETIEVLRWLFLQADGGASLRSMTKQLHELGIRPPQADRTGATLWCPASLKLILTNRCYIGEGIQFSVKVERHPDPKFKELKTRRTIDPDGDGAIPLPPGIFPVVIDPTQFERVQRRLSQNKSESQRRDRDPEVGLLRRGMARCGCCNSSLGFAYRGAKDSTGKSARYTCQILQQERHEHPRIEMSVPLLDRQVWHWVKELRNDPHLVERFADRVRKDKGANDESAAALVLLDSRIANLDGQRTKLAKRLGMVDDDSVSLVTDELQRLTEQRKALAMQREHLAERAQTEIRRRQRIERSVEIVSGIAADDCDLDAIGYHEKRRIMRDLGIVVRVYPNGHSPRWGMTLGFDNEQTDIRAVSNGDMAVVWDKNGNFDEAIFYLSTRPSNAGTLRPGDAVRDRPRRGFANRGSDDR